MHIMQEHTLTFMLLLNKTWSYAKETVLYITLVVSLCK